MSAVGGGAAGSGAVVLHGIGVGAGTAVGPVLRLPETPPSAVPAEDADTVFEPRFERDRAAEALATVAAELRSRAAALAGEARAVLEATALMAADPALLGEVSVRVDAGARAEQAVSAAVDMFRGLFTEAGGRTAERADDLADIGRRVLARLRGAPQPALPDLSRLTVPVVLVTADLAPADAALLDPARVAALVTGGGGPTGHTAILARAAGIPAVVAVGDLTALADGMTVLIDAAAGVIELEPGDERVAMVRMSAIAQLTVRDRGAAAEEAAPAAGALADGTPIALLANIAGEHEVARAIELGAEGAGLVRTELLFGDSTEAPAPERQLAVYTRLLSAFAGRPVTVRVFDAGADKPLAFLASPGADAAAEPNPALGLRGIRALRVHQSLLREQLEALREAQRATGADLRVMAPMVADPDEAAAFTALARELGLSAAGVMAEVPSAAILADRIVAVCDFVSIGTNDLVQYTLAADRQHAALAAYQDPWHPAVLRLVHALTKAGAEAGVPVGVCGEAAADPALAVVLAGLGATSLSMTPAALAGVRAALSAVTLHEAQRKATAALDTGSAAAARAAATSA